MPPKKRLRRLPPFLRSMQEVEVVARLSLFDGWGGLAKAEVERETGD